MERLAYSVMNKELRKEIEAKKEILTSTYDHAKQYSNIIIFGGYAGIFAIWNLTKDELEKWQVLSVGLFVLASLCLFIIFELYGTYLRSTQIRNDLNELAKAQEENRPPKDNKKGIIAKNQTYISWWPYFFFGTVSLAGFAAVILICSFISGLLDG